jgi:Uma2 family endonuclease
MSTRTKSKRSERASSLCEIPLIRIPSSAGTHAGFRAWVTSDEFPEKLIASFFNGQIVIDMSPEELETHNKVKGEVYGGLHDLLRELDLGELYFDRILVTNSATGLSTEPDATFVSWASFEADRVRLVPRKNRPGEYIELEGTPNWILEVVSQSSVQKDTEELRDLYHRSGISEYWLIDARFDEVSFQILRRRRDRYVAVKPQNGWHFSTVFGRSFRLERRKNRLGRWRYTLEVAPA